MDLVKVVSKVRDFRNTCHFTGENLKTVFNEVERNLGGFSPQEQLVFALELKRRYEGNGTSEAHSFMNSKITQLWNAVLPRGTRMHT